MIYKTKVIDDLNKPINEIEIRCSGEPDPIAVSNIDGIASFSIKTQFSPGCNYLRCNNLRMKTPNGKFAKLETTVFLTNKVNTAIKRLGTK